VPRSVELPAGDRGTELLPAGDGVVQRRLVEPAPGAAVGSVRAAVEDPDPAGGDRSGAFAWSAHEEVLVALGVNIEVAGGQLLAEVVVRIHRLAGVGLVQDQAVVRPVEPGEAPLRDVDAPRGCLAVHGAVRLADGESVVDAPPKRAAREGGAEAGRGLDGAPDRGVHRDGGGRGQSVARAAQDPDRPGVLEVAGVGKGSADDELVITSQAGQIARRQSRAETVPGVVGAAERRLLEPAAVHDRAEHRPEELEDRAGPRVFPRRADGQVVVAVTVEVPRRERGAELVAGLVRPACVALEPGDDRSAECRRVADDDPDVADVLDAAPQVVAGLADGQIVFAVAVEIPGSQRVTEPAIGFIGSAERFRREEQGAGVRQAERRPPVHDDRAGIAQAAECLARSSRGEVVVPVAVEVPGGEGAPHAVAGLARAAALRPLADQREVGENRRSQSGEKRDRGQRGQQRARQGKRTFHHCLLVQFCGAVGREAARGSLPVPALSGRATAVTGGYARPGACIKGKTRNAGATGHRDRWFRKRSDEVP